jgi:hypothetical protein
MAAADVEASGSTAANAAIDLSRRPRHIAVAEQCSSELFLISIKKFLPGNG